MSLKVRLAEFDASRKRPPEVTAILRRGIDSVRESGGEMTRTIVGAFACILVAAGNGFAEEGRWMLMSRHGECAPIAVLARKVPDMGPVTSPGHFLQVLQSKGIAAERIDHSGDAVQVNVPQLELSPMFVRYETCTAFDRKIP
ncbi:MAG: hypothetical protein WC899_14535 [bacterium]|jgi:hypothetical protein